MYNFRLVYSVNIAPYSGDLEKVRQCLISLFLFVLLCVDGIHKCSSSWLTI